MTFTVTATKPNGESVSKQFDSRSEAEARAEEVESMGMTDVSIERATASDGGDVEVVNHTNPEPEPAPQEVNLDETESALAELGDSIEQDPLDVLPGYMITTVEGKPSLNKRGVSVLAYHYDIDVLDREVVVYPHETDYETAVVEIDVRNGDGRRFAGVGEAHVDETPKHQLLRMAETRAYKRAVIFATGTGIVGYQELMGELE